MKRILCVSAERRQIKNCIQWSMVAASAGDHYTHFIISRVAVPFKAA